jgi:hypothetical protein
VEGQRDVESFKQQEAEQNSPAANESEKMNSLSKSFAGGGEMRRALPKTRHASCTVCSFSSFVIQVASYLAIKSRLILF